MKKFFFRTKDKIKESEIRYRRLFESAKDGILILDFETGKITDANPYIIEIIDRPLNEIIGEKLWEIGLFSNKEESKLAFTELKTKGYIRFDDMPIQKQNGKITEVEFISNVYIENKKKVIQCNIRNVTDRKQILRKQKLTTKILLILNNLDNWDLSIKNILVEIKEFTKIEYIGIRLNKNEDYPYYDAEEFAESFNYKEKYLVNQNMDGEIIYEREGNSHLGCMCGNVLSGWTDASLPYFTNGGSFYSNNASVLFPGIAEKDKQCPTNIRCNTKDSESIALIPLYSGKKIIGLLQLNDKRPGIFSAETVEFLEKTVNTIGIAYTRMKNETKIIESEQNLKKQNEEFLNLNKEYIILNKQLNESIISIQNINTELISAKLKAEESDKLKNAFLANIGHEIRTPLNAIMGFSGFILDSKLSKAKFESFVQIINLSSSKLLAIVNDIIDISKIESDQLIIRLGFVDINHLMNELFETYSDLAKSKNISFHCKPSRANDQVYVETDEKRIKQVLSNLLSNAIKFTKTGEIEFGYHIKTEIEQAVIEFYVKDTGIGIAEENHILIFERFRQVETQLSKMQGGNGLGLSISKALIEKMGGTIHVTSNLGKGSTFIFTIPYTKRVENIVKPEIFKNQNQSLNWSEKTVLIVEDENINQTYLQTLLLDTKINILNAWDGARAVDIVKSGSTISLILMDIKMPIMDGYEALKLIKQIRPELPVIAQTAYALSHDKSQALEAGFDSYISKPIEKDKLLELMGKYLNQ